MTVVPITSTIRDIPSEVLLTKEDGMRRDAAANFDHIQTVSKAKLGALLTTLSRPKMREARRAIEFALGL